jgi:DNA recombination protein RmuC
MNAMLIAVIAVGLLVAVAIVFGAIKVAEAMGRMKSLAEAQGAAELSLGERLQSQERALTRLVEERMADVSKRLTDGLDQSTVRTVATMTDIQKRLALIDEAQKNLRDLSTQMVGLQDILSNKQARGAFGEVQLQDLVRQTLPPSAYEFQAPLSNGRRADCIVKLPRPPGDIAIDSKFPLESYQALCKAPDEPTRVRCLREFAAAITKHIDDIAERYIVPGETAEGALMFLPSEAIYAEFHASLPEVADKAFRAHVWIVSPTTLWATLHTIRAVLKDVQMREQAHVIQKEVGVLMQDVARLDERTENLQKHFDQATRDIGQIRTSAEKIVSRAEKITEIEVSEPETEQLAAPKAASRPTLVGGA